MGQSSTGMPHGIKAPSCFTRLVFFTVRQAGFARKSYWIDPFLLRWQALRHGKMLEGRPPVNHVRDG
jgi:hypothetical protein